MDLSEFESLDTLALCAVAAVFFLFWFLGRVDKRMPKRRFAALAKAFDSPLTVIDEFEERFEVLVGQRPFVVTQKLISRSGSNSSSSLYLLTSTPLGAAWQSHFLTVYPLGRLGSWLMEWVKKKHRAQATATDDDLGARYAVIDQGILPTGWMTHAVRQAIRSFYEATPLLRLVDDARLEAGEGQLIQRMLVPGKLNADDWKVLLQRQAAVADALNHAAQRRAEF